MTGMEHDRFDDVEVRFLHDPDAPQQPPRRPRRWVAGAVAAALVAGGFAAAASAGCGSGGDAAKPAAKKSLDVRYSEAGGPHMRDGKPCRRGERSGGHRERRDSDVSSLY
jgi:hypothetical protein